MRPSSGAKGPTKNGSACHDVHESPLTASTSSGGQPIGQAFVQYVVRDSRVQEAGMHLIQIFPALDCLLKHGEFPSPSRKPFRRFPFQSRANVGYPHLKQSGVSAENQVSDLSLAHSAQLVRGTVEWSYRWPVAVIAAEQLIETLTLDFPPSRWIEALAAAVVDSHRRLFDRFRNGELVAEGVFKSTGADGPISNKEWQRPNAYLDIQTGDLLRRTGRQFAPVWELAVVRDSKRAKPAKRQPRPKAAEQTLELELKKRGLHDGRHGKSDYQIALLLVDQSLEGEELRVAADRYRKKVGRYYSRRGLV